MNHLPYFKKGTIFEIWIDLQWSYFKNMAFIEIWNRFRYAYFKYPFIIEIRIRSCEKPVHMND